MGLKKTKDQKYNSNPDVSRPQVRITQRKRALGFGRNDP